MYGDEPVPGLPSMDTLNLDEKMSSCDCIDQSGRTYRRSFKDVPCRWDVSTVVLISSTVCFTFSRPVMSMILSMASLVSPFRVFWRSHSSLASERSSGAGWVGFGFAAVVAWTWTGSDTGAVRAGVESADDALLPSDEMGWEGVEVKEVFEACVAPDNGADEVAVAARRAKSAASRASCFFCSRAFARSRSTWSAHVVSR
jgi:hypothetical protein